jgi:predicted DsbA family dithiol-disulfide isomerase
MQPTLHLDFVSDVSCPWCAIGLSALLRAMSQLADETAFTLRCQPFELNPDMPAGGEDLGAHLTRKYGSSSAQQAQIRETIRARGEAVGFAFHPDGRGRIYNTFNAHRLLHWAGVAHGDRQLALKQALLVACHRDQQAMDDPAVLLACVKTAGLSEQEARDLLASDRYVDEVRMQEAFYTEAGIRAVPAVVINQTHVVSGAQPVEAYVQVLRQIAAAEA